MAITYSIDGGADAAKFNINATSGALTFKVAPDFEAPGDANKDNVYEVTIKATDSDGASSTKDVLVTVTDVAENTNAPPQITSAGAVSVKENLTMVMTVTATDPDDVTPPVEPPPVTDSDIPMSFDDPMFTGMTSRGGGMSLSANQSINRISISDKSSGNPSITCAGSGGNTLSYCRVDSRECLRAQNGTVRVDHCYLEATGQGSDHADVVQNYAGSSGANGDMYFDNCQIRAHNSAATAGIWTSDGFGGSVHCNNVIFREGPYGWRAKAMLGKVINIYANNVYFVGPFMWGRFMFEDTNGRVDVKEWTNVFDATIVNGQLVKGAAVPRPS